MVVDEMTAVSPSAREIVLEQVRHADFGSLGTIGAAILIVTSVLALRHLEMTLNEIWGVEDHRTWVRRFSDYLTVLIVAPMLTGVALSVGATLQSAQLLAEVVDAQSAAQLEAQWITLLPWLALVVAFSFLYWFFPNTSVKPWPALAGGIVAAILFSVARYFYVDLNIGVSKYNAIFGGFAALPLVLAWIYACWAVVLFGAEVAFASQNLDHYRREVRGSEPSMAEREAIGLRIALEIGLSFRDGHGPTTADTLSEELDLPVRVVREQIRALQVAGLLEQTTDEAGEEGVLPARPLGSISVSDVFHALRGERQGVDADAAASERTDASSAGTASGEDGMASAGTTDSQAVGAGTGASARAVDPVIVGHALIVQRVMREADEAFEAAAGQRSLEALLALRNTA
jgi:membrane protein